jgi:hypothetical protein
MTKLYQINAQTYNSLLKLVNVFRNSKQDLLTCNELNNISNSLDKAVVIDNTKKPEKVIEAKQVEQKKEK